MSVIRFTLTVEHVALLRRATVNWDDSCYDGAPCIDIKRPYGNSDVVGDVYEITTGKAWDYDAHEDRSISETDEALYDRLLDLHRSTEQALQVVLAAGSFEPGEYVADKYRRDWRRA